MKVNLATQDFIRHAKKQVAPDFQVESPDVPTTPEEATLTLEAEWVKEPGQRKSIGKSAASLYVITKDLQTKLKIAEEKIEKLEKAKDNIK